MSTAVSESLLQALTGYITACLPEAVLGLAVCVMFVGGTWLHCRKRWGIWALVALAAAGVALALHPLPQHDSRHTQPPRSGFAHSCAQPSPGSHLLPAPGPSSV